MRLLSTAAALGILCLATSAALAEETPGEELRCEHAKLNTADASTLDPGCWELGLSAGLTQGHRAFANSWGVAPRPYFREEAFGLDLSYGLAEDLTVGFGLGYVGLYDKSMADHTTGGWTDLGLSAKWRFHNDEARRLEIAYMAGLTLPTGSADVTDDFASLYNGVALTKDWTDRLTSNFDLGYNCPLWGHRAGYRGTLSADAALGYHVTPWLQPEIELNYAHDFARGGDADSLAATVGAIICISEQVRLSAGVQQALAGRNADRGTSFQAALTFSF